MRVKASISSLETPWLSSLRARSSPSSRLRTPSAVPAPCQGPAGISGWQLLSQILAVQQRSHNWPLFIAQDNPYLGWAFSVPSVIFSLMFTQGMYRFLLLLRLLLRLWGCIPSMCALLCVWGLCSSGVAAGAQGLKSQRPCECLTHRRLSAFNGLD